MRDKRAEGRWLLIGILISGGAGILLGFITKRPLVVIAAGMVSAYLVQRLRRASEEGEDDSNDTKDP